MIDFRSFKKITAKFDPTIIPKLDSKLQKGDMGRILIVGGSEEYCGAPFFASMSALKTGCDLVYLICDSAAGMPIKAYSPELIVYPDLDLIDDDTISSRINRVDCVVIGPGLSRQDNLQDAALRVMKRSVICKKSCVVDGDGIFLLSKHYKSISDYSNVVLTPNLREFNNLCKSLTIPDKHSKEERLITLSKKLTNSTIILKDTDDLICKYSEKCIFEIKETGSPRRCGGQGDILAGCIATHINWVRRRDNLAFVQSISNAAILSRKFSQITYSKVGRSMISSDIIHHIPTEILKLQ